MREQMTATREQIRRMDRIAIEQYAIPGVVLMENAGRHCARGGGQMLREIDGAPVAVVCGRGNNGGDGFVAGRHLANWGAEVQLVLVGEAQEVLEAESDAAVNLRIIQKMGLPIREAPEPEAAAAGVRRLAGSELMVDALLGTGISGEVREPFRAAIQAINDCSCPVLAVDVPSGLDCDTGRPLGVAVRADRTVTFVLAKAGFPQQGAEHYTGRVEVAEIGIPRQVIERVMGASD